MIPEEGVGVGDRSAMELRHLWRVYPLGGADMGGALVDFDKLRITFKPGAIYGVGPAPDNGGKETKRYRNNGAILLEQVIFQSHKFITHCCSRCN